VQRASRSPVFYPKMWAPQTGQTDLIPHRPPRFDAVRTRGLPIAGSGPCPAPSLIKQDPPTRPDQREGPPGDLPFYPNSERTRGRPWRTRDAGHARRRSATAAPDKAANGSHRSAGTCSTFSTFSTEDGRPLQPGTGTARRQGGRRCGRRAGSGRPGTASRSAAADDSLAELLLTFMAAAGKQPRGKEPGLGPQYALMPR
jgi:hypothetical protein